MVRDYSDGRTQRGFLPPLGIGKPALEEQTQQGPHKTGNILLGFAFIQEVSSSRAFFTWLTPPDTG